MVVCFNEGWISDFVVTCQPFDNKGTVNFMPQIPVYLIRKMPVRIKTKKHRKYLLVTLITDNSNFCNMKLLITNNQRMRAYTFKYISINSTCLKGQWCNCDANTRCADDDRQKGENVQLHLMALSFILRNNLKI